ncbi:fumarylacetoacetate (FAA) hydrolase [Solidesulfovibrio carbinoliphilus subsp. oakridgensis]|uniref:Fumarylacetoacetate (FAA) hydrolase n=1 Tax=Solidesulfovibrio carbinoliphilus subsp. oakridgensis TaxID=694327 RepID=G7Q7S3_9BACT|nr:fumarylacetoacetate hydrolase family protein [Solidesulfovibrio carbinoliphilus]EHJ47382.1 fumarylacetoacetate (FAA) hydrolase [Solidesulfovibrio carbinoliphilus subsp. oakridgensis]
MKVLRVRRGGATFYGQLLLEEAAVRCLDRSLGLPDPIPLAELQVLPPVSPSKVVCAAGNFRSRLRELGRDPSDAPMLFLKPPSAVIGSGQGIVLPRAAGRVEAFAELAIVIGRTCRNVAPENVLRCLFGYSCANDVTAGDLRGLDEPLGRAKGFDTFAPIGPWIETTVADPSDLGLRLRINDRLVQEEGTGDMVVGPLALVSFVSSIMTLLPGDVVLSGSPAGGGALSPGDEVRVEIDEVGVLINAVLAEAEAAPLQ